MKRLAIIVILFSMLLCSFGCAIPKPSAPANGGEGTTPSLTGVAYLDMDDACYRNTDADPQADELEVHIQPYDINDIPIDAEGVVSAKLFLATGLFKDVNKKGELVREWYDIHISKDDYGSQGALLCLEYGEYVPEGNDENGDLYGVLEVTFTTFDQKNFSAHDLCEIDYQKERKSM
jgi:hypothetical protein